MTIVWHSSQGIQLSPCSRGKLLGDKAVLGRKCTQLRVMLMEQLHIAFTHMVLTSMITLNYKQIYTFTVAMERHRGVKGEASNVQAGL